MLTSKICFSSTDVKWLYAATGALPLIAKVLSVVVGSCLGTLSRPLLAVQRVRMKRLTLPLFKEYHLCCESLLVSPIQQQSKRQQTSASMSAFVQHLVIITRCCPRTSISPRPVNPTLSCLGIPPPSPPPPPPQ